MSSKLANFSRAIDPAVVKVFNGEFKKAGDNYKEICSVSRAASYLTEMGANTNLSMAKLRTEQDSLEFENFLQDTGKNLTQYEYNIGTKISRKLMKWQKMNQIKSMVAGAAHSLVRRREFDITKLLERHDATAYTHTTDGTTVIDLTGGASLALGSTSHASNRSSTSLSNIIGDGSTANMDLGEDALEAAETNTAPDITDESDQVIEYNLSDVYVSRKKWWTLMRLLKTSAGRVGTPNNDINLVFGRYTPHRLSYQDISRNEYWAMQDKEMNRKEGFMTYLTGSELEKDGPYVDFDTKAIKFSWLLEFAAGHNKWQSYLVSSGANA